MNKEFPSSTGHPFTLGVKKFDESYSFSIICQTSSWVNLIVQFENQRLLFPMHKEGDRFHIKVSNLPESFIYSYEIENEKNPEQPFIIADPYAKSLTSHFPFGNFEGAKSPILGYYFESFPFEWGSSSSLDLNPSQMIIYEMHLKGFTQNSSSQVAFKGAFLGMIEKIPYLKSLGVNAVELLPIMEFNECEIDFNNPVSQERLVNFWGYSTLNFFSIMKRYASQNDPAIAELEFKQMIKALHDSQIAVLLDVVYNHTGETFHLTQLKCYSYLAKESYYILEGIEHTNFTGCGNTFNTNHKITQQLIIDSLKFFVENYKVDGFRFDLASIFMRDTTGTPVTYPPLIESIQNDPILKKKILISEPWDAAGLYQVGSFPSPFLEWNGWYRDIVRHFFNIGNIYIGDLIECLSASPRLYSRYKPPYASINFITCHDGFSLHDLVSYQEKHNLMNGEENRDGSSHNLSLNFGVEGKTDDLTIRFLRRKQQLNFFCFLFSSFGLPMFLMGDERGQTKEGNNNSWCQNNFMNELIWDQGDEMILEGVKRLIKIRQSIPFYNQENYSFLKELSFIDANGNPPDLHSYGNFLAMTFYDSQKNCHVYIAFNASLNTFIIRLPNLKQNQKWHLYFNSYSFASKKEIAVNSMEEDYPITGQTCLIALSCDKI